MNKTILAILFVGIVLCFFVLIAIHLSLCNKVPVKMLSKNELLKIACDYFYSEGYSKDWEPFYDDNNIIWCDYFERLSSKSSHNVRRYKKFKDSNKYQAVLFFTTMTYADAYVVFIDKESGQVVDNSSLSALERFKEN